MEKKSGLQIAITFFNVSGALFLFCGICAFLIGTVYKQNYGIKYFKSNYGKEFFISTAKDAKGEIKDSNSLAQRRVLLKDNFKSLKDHYSDVSKDLNLSIQNLIAIATLGLLLLFFENIIPKNGVSVPLISVTVPVNLIYFIVIFGLIYLWVHIGLLTNDANDCRLSLITLLHELETIGGEKIAYRYSVENTLADSGIIDNMCAYYYKIFDDKSKTTDLLSTFGLFGIYGTLFGISMGVCFTTIFEFAKREKLHTAYFFILFVFANLIYLLSTIVVCRKMPHMIAWFSWWWIVCGSFMLFWKISRGRKASTIESGPDSYELYMKEVLSKK